MSRRLRTALAAVFAIVTVSLGASACAPAPASSEPANLLGTWTGSYSYPLVDGTVFEADQTIVVERQEGANVWGYQEWANDQGPQRTEFIGQVGVGGNTFVLTEEAGFFSGFVDGDSMAVRFIRIDEQHTTFELELTRTPSSS
jgi:hypothetical protein